MIDTKVLEKIAQLDDATILRRLPDNERTFFEYGFQRGYNRALKDLWHPNTEEPREFAEVLAEAKITESIKTYISFKRNDALFKNWYAYSSGANITRWLYIDDLFQKKGD